jgi:hypothetical protein
MDVHSSSEVDRVYRVTVISCWIREVFMEVYLAAYACHIWSWRLSYPE